MIQQKCLTVSVSVCANKDPLGPTWVCNPKPITVAGCAACSHSQYDHFVTPIDVRYRRHPVETSTVCCRSVCLTDIHIQQVSNSIKLCIHTKSDNAAPSHGGVGVFICALECNHCETIVFSTVGDIASSQKSQILPENVDMLIFLKKRDHILG